MCCKSFLAVFPLASLLAFLPHALRPEVASVPAAAEKKIANFSGTDPRTGKTVTRADFKDRKAVVVVFLGTECPINNQFIPRLVEFQNEFGKQGVQVLGINANLQDTPDRVVSHAKKFEINFPVLKDTGSAAADQFGAQRTPEAFVLDASGVVRYQGRIDDQFGIGFKRAKPTRNDLKEAIVEVLAGKSVTQATTEVAGCLIARTPKPAAAGTITYTKHVARIIQNNCQECHRPGQIGPFALQSYDDAVAWAANLREVVAERRMPPWFADPAIGKFANDRSLSKEDRETLLAWVDQGCPKGEAVELPPAKTFVDGWVIGKPDAVFYMPESFEVPADTPKGGVPYKYYTVETNFKEDRWISAAEARGGANEVVHHIIVFIVPPGQGFNPNMPGTRVLCGTAPGDMPFRAPYGMAKKLPAGSKLVFQMHYTPNGKKQTDRSYVGLMFAREPIERQIMTMPIGNPAFRIPPGDDNHEVKSQFAFKEDARILGFMPHMHLRGKDFKYEIELPDKTRETLLSVPRYNFNWQSGYALAQHRKVPAGTRLLCTAHFDNSAKNPNNPDPSVAVRWGEQTWEEMMIGWTDFVYEKKPE